MSMAGPITECLILKGAAMRKRSISADAEPEIYAASRRFGTVLENVVLVIRMPNFDDGSLAENTVILSFRLLG